MTDIQAVCDYWLADAATGPDAANVQRERWYRGGPEHDAEIVRRFSAAVNTALEGGFADWQESAEGSFAMVVLLDQFTRTVFRRTPRAFAGDPRAYAVAEAAVAAEHDRALCPPARIFLYHPYHHAESIADQDRSIALLERMRTDVDSRWHAYVDRAIAGFGRHRDIIARFGRYPHRNAVLGRASTAAEREYLGAGPERFGQ